MSFFRRFGSSLALASAAMMALSASAGAITLGSTTGTLDPCSLPSSSPNNQEVIQTGTDGSTSYTVPTGGGEITSWSFNTTGAVAGTPYGIIVVAPTAGGYTIVGSDVETVPGSAPTIQSYTLATPIPVQAGDLIGDVVPPGASVGCGITEPGVTTDTYAITTSSLTVGSSTATITTGPGILANVAVTLDQSQDAGITQTSTQSSVTTGATDALLLSVTGTPGNQAVSVTDIVPSGLKIDSVVTSSGSCSTSVQTIMCTGVMPSATIAVIVTATQAGQYTNNATVSTLLADPNPANNTSSAALTVASPLSPTVALASVRWSSLAKLPLSEARAVIRDLGLKVGKITHKHSKSILKGDVISTSALSGQEVTIGTAITIVVSSGTTGRKRG